MFTSVLVANRGEIAVRIIRTLRQMGIRSVIAASIPDRRGLAVRCADDWVLLEGYSAAESYLDAEAIIAAAKAKGCNAIHPGYGFLSERADFAERCASEGIVFVGPPPSVLRSLGDKSAARQLAVANGVPVVPGWDGADDDTTLAREAARIGYPIMVKARGGGGGRGMREVHESVELAEALASARREALAAFGDGGLLIEKLITDAHHVEVQVLADAHGHVIHLGERDCSVQRRRQKLIEESPSPVVDEALRAELTGAALKLARAVGYVNAGTFEFLVGEPGAGGRRPFYFLEVNPRLQVEHPVTETVTGLDLVELQLRVAAGEELPLRQEDVKFEGHAIEFRINAEDPWDDFKPSSGRITAEDFRFVPERVDTGYGKGDTIPSNYDSLLAKLVVDGEDRESAIDEALHDLESTKVEGVATNVALHRQILQAPAFSAGGVSIGWLERELPGFTAPRAPHRHWLSAAASLVWAAECEDGFYDDKNRPWRYFTDRSVWLSTGRERRLCHIGRLSRRQASVRFDWESQGEFVNFVRVEPPHRASQLLLAGDPSRPMVAEPRSWEHVDVRDEYDADDYESWTFQIIPPPPLPRRPHTAAEGATAITAPLAGTIAAIPVQAGDTVEAGQVLVLLEAMKMEHRITATAAGTVRAVLVREGGVVREGDVLIEMG